MKVLRIWHAAVLAEYRKKIRAISDIEEINLTLLLPDSWRETGTDISFTPHSSIDSGYTVITGKVLNKNNIRKYVFLTRLFSIMKEFRPDVIDIEEEPSALVTAQALWYRRLLNLNAPVIFHTAHNIPSVHKPMFEHIQKHVLSHADGAIVRNTDAKKNLLDKGFHKPIFISGNGIDLTHFYHFTNNALHNQYQFQGKFVIGYVGKLKAAKGIMTLLKAFTLLNNVNFRLILIGSGGLQSQVEAFIHSNGLKKRVFLLGHQEQKTLPEYYNLMDTLIIPSETTPKWKESFGRVIIEAMACGVPVIGSSSGSIPETILEAGLIFQEKNHEELAQKITLLYKHPTLREELTQKGLIRAKLFTWASLAKISYNAYQEVLKTKR